MKWDNISLGEVIDVKHGYPFKSEFFSDTGDLILLSPGNCHEAGGLKLKGDKEKYYIGEYPEEYLLSEGEIIVVMTDLINTAPILGGAFLIPESNRFLHNQRLGLVHVTNEKRIDRGFLLYLLNSSEYRGQIRGSASGATVRHTAPNRIKECRLRIPKDISYQKKVGDLLSAYDDLIDNNRRRMALLEDSARRLYREWFVRLRFPGHEHTPIVDGVPQGWERKTLGEVCSSGNGIQTGPFGSQLHQADYSETGVPVVMPKDIIDFRVSETSIARIPEDLANHLGRHRMVIGDTVYGRRGDIGRRAYIGKRQQGWFCGTGSLRIRPDPVAINPLYLFDFLGAPATVGDITNRAKGSTMLNLSAAALKPLPVLVPLRSLQDLYAEQVAQVREMLDVLDEQNQKLRQARDLLLPRLMNGELAV
ncbi:MAG: restriction endonuclease subunit S [Limnohabitans sp.]|nr:restriction endonuclease subunit S [Limnohabitans sp.]